MSTAPGRATGHAIALLWVLGATAIGGAQARPARAAGTLDRVIERIESHLSHDADPSALARAVELCDSVLAQVELAPGDPARSRAIARILQLHGFAFYLQEEFEAALPWYERAHALIVEAAAKPSSAAGALAAEITSDHAELLRLAGRTREAEAALQEAVELAAAAAPRTRLHAVTLNNLAGVYKDRGEFSRAESLLEEALLITEADAQESSERLATAHLNLAEVYRLQDRHDFAEPHYRRALRFAREALGDRNPELVYFLAQFATLCSERGELDAAVALRDEALGLLAGAPRSTRFLEAELQRAIGEDLLAREEVELAIERLRGSLRSYEELFGAEHWISARCRTALARALSRGNAAQRTEAAAQLEASIASAAESAPEVRVEALGLRATLHERDGSTARAVEDLESALEGLEQLRVVRGGGTRSRALLVGTHVDLFHELIRLRIERGEPALAFRTLERMRARTLLDELDRSGIDPRADLPAALRDSLEQIERAVTARIARHQDRLQSLPHEPAGVDVRAEFREHQLALDQALLELGDVQEEMRQRSPRWRERLAETRVPMEAEAVPELLGERGVWLAYAIGARRSFLLEIASKSGTLRAHELRAPGSAALGRAEVERRVRELRTSLQCTRETCASERDEALRDFANVLVPRDVRSRLRAADLVVVAADGALLQLPFESLIVDRKRDGSAMSWLESYGPTLYSNSATALRELRAREQRESAHPDWEIEVLSVSDPAFRVRAEPSTSATTAPRSRITLQVVRGVDAGALPPLPGTRAESDSIRATFAGQHVVVLQDSSATEAAVRHWAPRARYVHLATHGFASWNGSRSLATLVLSAPREVRTGDDDGLLQSYEIHELGLGAELAVLSACETALGEHIEGEGMFALGRDFLAAGAARVIATLWPVSDRASVDLVSALFRGVSVRGDRVPLVGVARALRLAKLHVALDPRSAAPFYWAPFVLMGVD